MSSRGRLCLHAPLLFPVLGGVGDGFVGGAEVQQALVARGLAARGFEVTVVTCDFGQPDGIRRDGVRYLKSYPPLAGVPVLRFLHPRLTRAAAALWRADADLYYARGSGIAAALAHDIARIKRAAFVYGAAHDYDTDPRFRRIANPRDRWWFGRAVRGADLVIAQSEFQRGRFRERLGRESVVVPNLAELPDAPADAGRPDGAVVWLGTYKPSKRPEWFVELARRIPGRRFVMCGVVPMPPETRAAWEAAQAAGEALPNLTVRGYLDHERVGELFRGAALFVHTSYAEGFSNTLLEAWAHALPAVIALDPDGVLEREGLGARADTLDGLEAAVRAALADDAGRRAAGERARSYVARRHAPEAVLDALAARFDAVVARVRSGRRR